MRLQVAALGVLVLSAARCLSAADTLADLKKSFANPPADARIMVRWWWFGPSVTKPELERELRTMKEGGIGGVEVQSTYPLALDDPASGFHNFRYVFPEFLDDLTFTGRKAEELGMRLDLTLGSGWPFGGPHISINQAAGRLRVVRATATENGKVTLPQLAEGESLVAAFQGGQRLTAIDGGAVSVPGSGPVEFFIASHTRMMVKRPAVGAEGLVLDHYDRAAIETHLKFVGEPMLKSLAQTPPHAIFSDSLEVGSSDWTTNFLAEFRKRRGYDLMPYLPALAGDIGEKTMAVRHDWGKTLTELADDNYLRPLTEFAHQHHTLFRSQSYGTPPTVLSSNAIPDLPEGEGTQWRHFSATRWAASASHLYGRPVTSSETWTWLHSPVFRATPLDMKAEADLHFIQGINQLIAHGYPYSPPEAGEPGWRFYAAAVFNNHNPWWLVMPDITLYLQRVSFLLRQGQPANDVALYLPTDDAWAGFTLGHDSVNQAMDGLLGPNVVSQILDAGYNFDFIDDGAIAHGGVPYKILVVPGARRIPLATMQKIDEYRRKGGTVIVTGRLPSLAPGLQEEGDAARIREIASTFTVTNESKLGEAMHAAVAADVATVPEVGFIHRHLPFGEVYFVANTSNHPVHSAAVFRVKDLKPEWWDPFTGKTTAAASTELDLAPYESRVLVFSNERLEPAAHATASAETVDLSGDWKVTFPGKAEEMKSLHSWTDDEDTKYFSGQATYERTAAVPKGMLTGPLFLTFGEGTPVTTEEKRAGNGMRALLESPVHEAAVVYVNGKRAGSVWHPPYELEVTNLLRAGDNSIRIVVANLALNAMAKGPLPDYKELNAKYGERFQAQDMNQVKPIESGLLGPIRLVTR
jgi:glycosyl hydrolase family 106( putative alpha-L-rhamnosidase)